jgi:hypothetical protein
MPGHPRAGRHHEDPAARIEEAKGLALAIGLEIAEAFAVPIREARPGTLFGEGQIDNILVQCNLHEAELVIVDGSLSAVQQRNLEEKLKRKVIDRTGSSSKSSASARRPPKAACRSNWRIWTIRRAVWCGPGPTLSVSAAALASLAVPAKRRSRPTAA